MKHRHKLFITSATAALLAGTVLAAAQGMQKESPGGAGGMEKGGQGQMQREQGKGQQGQREQGKGQTTGQGEREQGKAQQGQREERKGQTTGQGERERNKDQQGQREQGREQGKGQREQGQREPGKGTTGQGQPDQGQAGQREQGKQAPSQREGQGTQPGGREGAQQGGGGSVSFTTEQRTKIRQTVLQGGSAPRVNNVNFSLRVGIVVPQTVRVIAVPEVLVEIHPQWRGFFYFIVGDEIIIVDRNHHIVAVFTV
jgi:Protein of unknown function (DUF1236)